MLLSISVAWADALDLGVPANATVVVVEDEAGDGLPVPRAVPALVRLVPGVLAASFAGASSHEVEWRIDGFLVSDPVTGGFRPERAGPRLRTFGPTVPLGRPVVREARLPPKVIAETPG